MTDPLPIAAAGHPRGGRAPRHTGAWRFLAIAMVLLCMGAAVPAAGPIPGLAPEMAPAPAAGEAPAGWIETFAGPAADYRLSRGDRSLAVYPLMQVLPGDEISVPYPDGRLRLHLGETATLDLDQAQSPYRVPTGGPVPTLAGNLMQWAGRLFAGLAEAEARTVPLAGRGDAADWPETPVSGLLVPGTRLGAGPRPLALAWRGGQAPYRVRLAPAGADERPVAEATGLAEPRCALPAVALSPGGWVLSIGDAASRTLVTGIAVVPGGEVPRLEPAALPSGLPDTVARTLAAAWLAGQGEGGLWRLDAYQEIADLGDDTPADWLRRALVAGEPLPPHPPAQNTERDMTGQSSVAIEKNEATP